MERVEKAIAHYWLQPVVGATIGFLVWCVAEIVKLGSAAETGVIVAFVVFGLVWLSTMTAERWKPSALFSMGLAALLGGLAMLVEARYRLATGDNAYGGGDAALPLWFSGFLMMYLIVPFWLTAQATGRWTVDYRGLHRHAWTLPVQTAIALAFAGLFYGLVALLAALMKIVGLGAFERALQFGAVSLPIWGGATGFAIAVVRSREGIVASAREIAIRLLAALTPLIAGAALLFLVMVLVVGPRPLWETESATTILMAVFSFGLLAANAVIDDRDEDAARSRLLQTSARLLGLALLPLALLAAWSLALRIGQYGLTPDRMIAAIGVTLAIGYGLAYLAALIRRWSDWRAAVRKTNIILALGLIGVLFLMLTPVLDPATWSARHQTQRLLAGKVDAASFDYGALKFDMGRPGKRALERIAAAKDHPQAAEIAAQLARLAETESRWDWTNGLSTSDQAMRRANFKARLVVLPKGAAAPAGLLDHIATDHVLDARTFSDGNRSPIYLLMADGLDPVLVVPDHKIIGAYLRQSDGGFDYRSIDMQSSQWAAVTTALSRGDVAVVPVTQRAFRIGARIVPPAPQDIMDWVTAQP